MFVPSGHSFYFGESQKSLGVNQVNIKFLVKLGKSGPKICQMLQQAYGKDALKGSTVSSGSSIIEKAENIPRKQ
jgi:hypothetical protein